MKIPSKIKKAILVITVIVLGFKLLYYIGGGAFLGAKVITVVSKDMSAFISEDIPNLKYNSDKFYNGTLTINFLLFNPDKSKYNEIREKVDKKACSLINKHQDDLASLNLNIHTSRNNQFVYSYAYTAKNCT